MMGMGFLRLNKILRKHKWKRADREEELEKFHAREDRVTNGCLIAFVVGIVVVIALSSIKGMAAAGRNQPAKRSALE